MNPRAADVQIVAHRGSSKEEPEHSLAAYLAAVRDGADAVECDVRMTADGTLVLFHDRRIDRTSLGRGTVSAQSLAELNEYTFGGHTWHDFEDPPSEMRSRLLTLEDFLSVMLDASSIVQFAIETKHPTRFGKYVEEELVRVLGLFRLLDSPRVRVMSFSRSAVMRMPELSPGMPTVFLVNHVPILHRDGSRPRGCSIMGPGLEVVRKHPDYVRRVHEQGGAVHVWTVDEREDVDLCVDLGVQAIITNKPAQVRAWLGR